MNQTALLALANALNRTSDDALVTQIAALIDLMQSGALSAEQATTLLQNPTHSSRPVVSFEHAPMSGHVTIRDIAGRDIINITIAPQDQVDSMDINNTSDLLKQIMKVRETLAEQNKLPEDDREDIDYALKRAYRAGDEANNARLLEKLNEAQTILNKLAPSVPEAKQLATTVGALIKRAMSLFAPQQQGGRSHNQQISDNAQVGVAVSGDVHGGINYHAPGSGPISGDYVAGDKFTGDKVMGDKHVINNHAANQGAQGTFYGPVTFNNAPTAGGKIPAGEQADRSDEDERTRQVNALREEIRNNRSNLYKLKMQVAQFGGEMWTPVGVSNNIDAARKAIRDAKGKLRRLGEQVTDMPDDED